MLTFILFALLLVVTTAADTYTTHRIIQRGGVEQNTLLYGERPSLRRLIAVGAAYFAIAFALGATALHYGDVFASVFLFALLSAGHLFGAINNALQLRK